MNRSKKISPIEETDSKIKYTFSSMFNTKFDALIKVYSDSLESLNKMNSGKISCDYGVCATSYNVRYITPKNISTFVDNLLNVIGEFFHNNVDDINIFLVASVKKFFEENEGTPIEDSATIGDGKWVNTMACTLKDLEMICTNDLGPVAVYSKGEIVQRISLMNNDLKKMNEMHFAANAKKLVAAMPKIINDACMYSPAMMKAIMKTIEDFLLFAVTVNLCTVLQMYAYCNPATDYTFKKEKENEEAEEKTITECCMCKTNDYMIRNRIPFNCNMRDVALQDVTPDFKDIHDAMHFIIKDPRSPICILVNKYASENGRREIYNSDIARMFLGVNKCHEHCMSDIFKKDAELLAPTVKPLEAAGFETHVDWLDTIAFGNNYLDGNYRRDAVGNNKFHPITNSMDAIFKMYSGCDLKTNEEIANNILSIAGAMKNIVHEYREGNPIENYDLTKDVLVLLGEILTRNMLRLYYNNTHVLVYKDDMPNTMIPGFVNEAFEMETFVEEGFVMEQDGVDTTGATNPEAAAKPDTKNGSVAFADATGNAIKKPDVSGIKKLMQKISEWFKKVFMGFKDKFSKDFNQYAEFVGKNKETNAAIGTALKNSSLKAELKDVPNWTIDLKKVTDANVETGYFEKILNNQDETANEKFMIITLKMLGLTTNVAETIANGLDKTDMKSSWKEVKTKLFDYYFYKDGNPDKWNKPMGEQEWNTICTDIVSMPKVVNTFVDSFEKKRAAVNAVIEKVSDSSNDQVKRRADILSQAYKVAFTDLAKAITTNLANPIAKSRYTLYKATYDAYNTQKANAGMTNANATEPKAEETTSTETQEGGNQ